MSVLELSRWQFGITTVYHFLFVPITIGLGFIVAGFETAWVRTGQDKWLRLTKFYGKLFLINFAIGVVTGIVQEFQFGMNWSAYSRYVGDIFGAPLASRRCSRSSSSPPSSGCGYSAGNGCRGVHAACIWIVAMGTLLSAYFILTANSWMQHPVGYHYNQVRPPGTHHLRGGADQPGSARRVPAHHRGLRSWSPGRLLSPSRCGTLLRPAGTDPAQYALRRSVRPPRSGRSP